MMEVDHRLEMDLQLMVRYVLCLLDVIASGENLGQVKHPGCTFGYCHEFKLALPS